MPSVKLLVILSVQILLVLAVPRQKRSELQLKSGWPPSQHQKILEFPPSQPFLGLVIRGEKVIYMLKAIIDMLCKQGHVTLIGWQNIWKPDGTLKEIKTIEFTIPGNADPEKELISTESETLLNDLPDLLHILDASRKMGTDIVGSVQQWDRNGELKDLLYVDHNDIYFRGGTDELYLIRNITKDTYEEVKTVADGLESDIPAGTLVWNRDGSFDSEKSVIVPELLASIEGSENASYEMLEEALLLLCQGYLEDSGTVLEYVSTRLNEKFPDHNWIAVNGYDNAYINKDVTMSLSFDFTDLADNALAVDVIGVLRSKI